MSPKSCIWHVPSFQEQFTGLNGQMRHIDLHCLAVGGFEANAVVDEIVHNEMILLLDVAEDAKPCAARHSQASGACRVQCHEDVVWSEVVIGAGEMEHHCGVGRIGNSRSVETILQSVEGTICGWVWDARFHRRQDGSEGTGLEISKRRARIKNEATISGSINFESSCGVIHCLACDSDPGDAGVVKSGIRVVGQHGRVRHAARGGSVADVERAGLAASQRHQAVREFLASNSARLRNERQWPFAEPDQTPCACKGAQVTVAAAEGHIGDGAISDR